MRNLLSAGLLLLILLVSTPGWCEESDGLQTFQVFYENDLFGDTDKYYTNALQMTWLSKDLKQYKDDVRLPDCTGLPVQGQRWCFMTSFWTATPLKQVTAWIKNPWWGSCPRALPPATKRSS
jgi:hypothetical protein